MTIEKERPWSVEDGPHELLVGTRGHGAQRQRATLIPFLDKYGVHVRHISWSRKAPHLIVILSLAGLYEKGGSAAGLYEDLATVVASTDQ
jgi:hypothetical protein